MKMIIPIIIAILMSSIVFATINRDQPGGSDTIRYTTGVLTGSYDKAYWAVDENVASCDVTNAICSGTNVDCDYVGGAIRVVAYTPDGGGSIAQSVTVTVTGTGSCPLNNGYGVESYTDTPGSSTSLSGSVTLSLGGACNGQSDRDCSGTISLQEILDAIANIYGDTTYFSIGTFISSNIGIQITGYYGAMI